MTSTPPQKCLRDRNASRGISTVSPGLPWSTWRPSVLEEEEEEEEEEDPKCALSGWGGWVTPKTSTSRLRSAEY